MQAQQEEMSSIHPLNRQSGERVAMMGIIEILQYCSVSQSVVCPAWFALQRHVFVFVGLDM